MASWWETRKLIRRWPWDIAVGRELPPIPKVSLFNPRPFVFSTTDKEYDHTKAWNSTWPKLHVPTKMVRSAPAEWTFTHTDTSYDGANMLWKSWRVSVYAEIIGLYLLLYLATTDNFLREAVHFVDLFCTYLLNTCAIYPWLNYIYPVLHTLTYLTGFLLHDAWTLFNVGVRVATVHLDNLRPNSLAFDAVYVGVTSDMPAFFREHLLYNIPNNFYCVGTFWLTFVFIDTLLLLIYFMGFAGLPGHYYAPFYGYVFLKAVTFVLPFLYISPNDRLYFWFIVLAVLAAEIAITTNLCWVINYGFRWEFSARTVYHSWGRHFKYQIPTGNSNLYRDTFSWFIYPIVKCYYFGLDAFCSTLPGYGSWFILEPKRWGYTVVFPELYVQRVRGPQVGTTGFATRRHPLGYKTPKELAAEAEAIRIARQWPIDAFDLACRGVRHHLRARRLWRRKYEAAWAEMQELVDSGKATYRDLAWVEYHAVREEPISPLGYVAYYQFYADIPMDFRYARRYSTRGLREHWNPEYVHPKTGEQFQPSIPLSHYSLLQEIGNIFRWAYGFPTVHPEPIDPMLRWQVDEFIPLPASRNFIFYPKRRKGTNHAAVMADIDDLFALFEQDTATNFKYGLLFLLAISSLSVYSIILAGWSSNSKYAFIGALRSAAQMISYEVAISLLILPVVLLAGSLNIAMIVYMQSITVWFLFPLFPAAILFVIAMLAETNRTPFDLPEAEAELVAGYNVDYSALPFAMFFLGEYCNMILISVLFCLLFLGGWAFFGHYSSVILAVKAIAAWFYFIHVRATLPRYRYDQLMDNGWKIFLPIAGGFFIFITGAIIGLDALPVTTELPLQEISRFALVRNSFSWIRCIASFETDRGCHPLFAKSSV